MRRRLAEQRPTPLPPLIHPPAAPSNPHPLLQAPGSGFFTKTNKMHCFDTVNAASVVATAKAAAAQPPSSPPPTATAAHASLDDLMRSLTLSGGEEAAFENAAGGELARPPVCTPAGWNLNAHTLPARAAC